MKVLISAYACEPGKGSEPGAGWNWSLAAARDNEVWVLTRANNRDAIETELARRPQPSLHFVYVDLPPWARRWKRGQRGVRLYYSLWQVAALREAKRLHAEIGFDLVHHVTFANAWLPALVGFIDAPLVIGPVDAGLSVPLRFYRELGARGVLAEWKAECVRVLGRTNPVVRRGLRRARLILAQNDESAARLRSFGRPVVVRPNASVDPEPLLAARQAAGPVRERSAIVAGRLVAWKGISLALRAIAILPGWTLEVVGSGPDERRLRRLAGDLGVAERVTFIPWLRQDELWRRMAAAAVVVVSSLREAASLVAAEAATLGVPVVALDQGGPRVLARMSPGSIQLVQRRTRALAIRGIATAISTSGYAERHHRDAFSVSRISDALVDYYAAAIRPNVHPNPDRTSAAAPSEVGRSRKSWARSSTTMPTSSPPRSSAFSWH